MPWKRISPDTELSEGDTVEQRIEITVKPWITPGVTDPIVDWFMENIYDRLYQFQREVNEELREGRLDIKNAEIETVESGEKYELVTTYEVLEASPLAASTIIAVLVGVGIAGAFLIASWKASGTFLKVAGAVGGLAVIGGLLLLYLLSKD